jgi:hypothetical protein
MHASQRQIFGGIGVVVDGLANLPQMILALRSSPGFSRGLNRRQQQGDQHADNRNHDKQLDESKTALSARRSIHFAILS